MSVWSNPPFSSPAPPPDPACDGKCGRTGEDDGEDDIDGEDDSDGDDPVYCPRCGEQLNSLEETLPFGRMVDCKLIPNAQFSLYSKSPSARLFSPQGLVYDFRFESYMGKAIQRKRLLSVQMVFGFLMEPPAEWHGLGIIVPAFQ